MRSARIPALDGIRGLAISLVLCWHTVGFLYASLPNHPIAGKVVGIGRLAWSGVDLFFVLSGFLIGGILLDAANSPSYFRTFYIRRAYRILPLYSVALIAGLIIDLCFHTDHLKQFFYYPFFLQNFQMARSGTFGQVGLDVTWSLAVEEQFYLTLPAVIRFVDQRILFRVLLGAILGAPVVRILLLQFNHDNSIAPYVLMPARADALCLGVLIAITMRTPTAWERISARPKILFSTLGVAIGLGLWIVLSSFQPFTGAWHGLEYSLLALIYAVLLLVTLASRWLSGLFSLAPLRFMGIVAYGIYLFHQTLVGFLFRQALLHFRPQSGSGLKFVVDSLAAVASIGLAALSWRYFEKPLVNRGHRYSYAPEQRTV